MKIGIHAPIWGFTERAKAVAAQGAEAVLWLPAEGPQDTQPGWVNLVRLVTPFPWETPENYADRVQPLIQRWYASGIPAIFIPGNEPDLADDIDVPQAWSREGWAQALPRFAAILRARWAQIALGCPPFSVANAAWTTADLAAPFDVVLAHCYWPADQPDAIQRRDAGGAWRYAVEASNGKPVWVTECNANPTNVGQIVAWLRTLDGVAGVTLFIADGQGTAWPFYDVTPDDLRGIRAGFAALPPPAPAPAPAPAPTPPPAPAPAAYSRDSDPRGYRPLDPRWLPAVAARNPGEAQAICDAVAMAAQKINYDANAMIAQAWVETADFTSRRWQNAHAAAGIGIFSDATLDVIWGHPPHGDVTTGIEAQADLLTCYFGHDEMPFGTLAPHGFGGMTLGKTALRGLDGVWAADPEYSAAIVGVLNSVLGGAAPAPPPPPDVVPLPQPDPSNPAPLPADYNSGEQTGTILARVAAEAMRHVGETRMGPGQPLDDQNGFVHTMSGWCEAGAATVVFLVTGERIRFPSAYAHAMSLSEAGDLDPNPGTAEAGEFDFWGPYSDGNGHITVRGTDGLSYGTSVSPDVWIGRPVSYYPSYLGHAKPEAVIDAAKRGNVAPDRNDPLGVIDPTGRYRAFYDRAPDYRGFVPLVGNAILDRWQQDGPNNGLIRYGSPVPVTFGPGGDWKNEYDVPLDQGQQMTIQWFERSRLEYHPLDGKVYLGRIGAEWLAYQQRQGASFTLCDPNTDNVDAQFAEFFMTHGGIDQFGLPLTPKCSLPGSDKPSQVFERCVMEFDADDGQWPVKLRLLGSEWTAFIVAGVPGPEISR